MIKKYAQYIAEADEVGGGKSVVSEDIKAEVREKVEATVRNSGGEYSSLLDKLAKDAGAQIEGLINDDQVYDFWLKHQNDIDEALNSVGFFDQAPSKANVLGVYNYVMACARKVIEMALAELQQDATK